MSRVNRLPLWAVPLVIGLIAAGFSLYIPWVHRGISHGVPARTYLFWSAIVAVSLAAAELVARLLYRRPALRERIDGLLIAFNDRP